MDHNMDMKKQELGQDFRPEPRDILVVLQDYVKEKGDYNVEPGNGIEVDTWKMDLGEYHLEHRIEGEYDDYLLVKKKTTYLPPPVILHTHDNTFNGVRFLVGDVTDMDKIYLLVKPLVEAEGGTF